jgi:hypothetical protein
MNQQ